MQARAKQRFLLKHLQPSDEAKSIDAPVYAGRGVPPRKSRRRDLFASAYPDARKEAASETGLPESTFPSAPPFSLEELVDGDFFPIP